MTVQNYLMINESTNLVENVCLWDGDVTKWQPPTGYFVLEQATTLAVVWTWDSEVGDWTLTQELGVAQHGFKWNGIACVTEDPKPIPPLNNGTGQPTVIGADIL